MSRRHVETITDYLIVAVSPALIIFLVGSMVFFLTHLFYDGNFPGRLRFACAMFVMAAVLIARISIENGREHASLFALPLSLVTILSVLKYTDASLLVVLPLVAFVWWSTDKLTWDCTVVDDQADTSGAGLLQTIGSTTATDDEQATTDASKAEAISLWQKWKQHRHRPHTPGVWVIYFGVGGLPLFGLGQWALDPAVRPMGFLLLCIFVASTLSLLMTTSFLQMRRYLLQRRLPFTDQMASIWLGTGGVLIVGLMLVAMFLPRPQTGYSILESFDRASARSDLRASRVSVGDEGTKDEQPGRSTAAGDETSPATSPDNGERSRGPSDADKQSESATGRPNDQDAQQPNDASQSEAAGGPSESPDQDGSRDNTAQTDTSDRPQAQRSSTNKESSSSSETQPNGEAQRARDALNDRQSPSPALSNPLQDLTFGKMARWFYFLLLAVGVLFVLFRYGREIGAALSAFFQELSSLFQRLLGRRSSATAGGEPEEEEEATVARPVKPFSSYPDPFLMGTVGQFTSQQLVNYTFEALQAWALERDCGRSEAQTPLEFASHISVHDEQVGKLARNLAILYNQAAYAPGILSSDTTKHLRSLWSALRAPAQV